METPVQTRNLRPRHVPTPKMSERKKSLFSEVSKSPSFSNHPIDEDSDLGPISPLELSTSPKHNDENFNIDNSSEKFKNLRISKSTKKRTTFKNVLNDLLNTTANDEENVFIDSQTTIIPATQDQDGFPYDTDITDIENLSPNSPKLNDCSEMLQKTPIDQTTNTKGSCQKNLYRRQCAVLLEKNIFIPSSADVAMGNGKYQLKRHHISSTVVSPDEYTNESENSGNKYNKSPKSKIQKLDSKACTSLSFDELISTKSFYSKKSDDEIVSPTGSFFKTHQHHFTNHKTAPVARVKQKKEKQPKSSRKYWLGKINKGVIHGIHKKRASSTKISPLISARAKVNLIKFNLLKKSILRDKTEEDKEKTKISMEQIRRINNIFRNMKNPIEMAQPLTKLSDTERNNQEFEIDKHVEEDFHDDDNDHQDLENKPKRFFKTARNQSVKYYRMTNRIRASVKGGKIAMVDEKLNRSKDFSINDLDLSEEHKEVNDIIDKLYDEYGKENENNIEAEEENETTDEIRNIELINNFTARLPYNTTDPEEMERQENLLQFLILNDLLDEHHFKVFITEPDQHTDEANKLLNEFVILCNMDEETGVYQGDDYYENIDDFPMSPTSQISNMTSELALESSTEEVITELLNSSDNINNNIVSTPVKLTETVCAENPNNSINTQNKLFPVFDPTPIKSSSSVLSVGVTAAKNITRTKQLWIPIGDNQYQIDAGQKEFGAKECKECGLVYSVHEPEDELMHLNFHNASHTLKFKKWRNERVVANIEEWSLYGRIISVTQSDEKFKLIRVNELLKIADKELGFTNLSLNRDSVVYLAIGKNMIMGLCVAQPLLRAYRLQQASSGEFCSIDNSVPVKCGISKIWVGAPYRRQGVARHLVNAVRSSFIFGHWMEFDELAFSSPTEAGKKLATNLTNRTDFLVY